MIGSNRITGQPYALAKVHMQHWSAVEPIRRSCLDNGLSSYRSPEGGISMNDLIRRREYRSGLKAKA